MGIIDIFRASKIKQENEQLRELLEKTNADKNSEIEHLKEEIRSLEDERDKLGITEYVQAKEKMEQLEKQAKQNIENLENDTEKRLEDTKKEITSNEGILCKLQSEINELQEKIQALQEKDGKLEKSVEGQKRKLTRCKELYKSVDYAINNFFISDDKYENCKLSSRDFEELELVSPSIILKLHCMDVKSLRKAYKDNEKQINKILEQYSERYTTKANKSIYNLMVIALRAELQNILYNLKYEKLDKSIEDVKTVSAKYLKIAGEGNQSIAVTLTKFIGEIEYLFINAVKIEYNYYVKREQARQEQLAIKEQMRQEAEERKALEQEKKKVEQEENKYKIQIETLTEQVNTAQGDELEALKARILQLQAQLSDVVVKKEEILNLQNGKAGNVYIISNLGSFGDDVFKIGMTRRLNPQDRINELGSASVPFKFDVHSFIFSEDAVNLENKLHNRLNDRRVNKVNLRKEFFRISIDELEKLVDEIEPTAEFNKTMMAEEFRQSESTEEVYSSEIELDDDDDE